LLDALRLQMHAQDRLGDVHLIRAAGPGDFAALVPTVIATAQAGDAVAAQLLVETVDALVRHVTALRVATGDGAGRTVALNGGLLAHDSVIRDTFVDQLARAHPDLRVRAEAVDPLRGALALAQRLEQVRAR
jgi:N-acetylglucosamine kinase-like BadF-type ATPase